MNAPLRLDLREALRSGVDVSILVPANFAGKSRGEIERLPLQLGNRNTLVGDLFEVSGEDAHHIIFSGDTGKLRRAGAALVEGRITIEGDAGDETGFAMTGGEIHLQGSSGHFTGCQMTGGEIRIEGNAGDFLGAALPGNMQGMRGGLIHVKGNCGDRAADRMRRGLILIEGNAGAYLGSRMLAGTVLVKGATGEMPGFALRRGTLILSHAPAQVPSYFNDCGVYPLLFTKLLERDLLARKGFEAFLPLPSRLKRWCGDLAAGAFGEILIPA
ncbi:MAG: formylmethanofuran dehydrogenase subunit C [Burkholderiales bacterium]